MAQSKRWCFTLNNPYDEDETLIGSWQTNYTVFGRETSSSGTPHLQGFVTFPQAKRLAGVRKLCVRAHWEVAKGTSLQAADYCKKDGNFFESGEVPSPGKRTDLEEAVDTLKRYGLKRVADEYPVQFVKFSRGLRDLALTIGEEYSHDDVRGVWIHGKPGSGKSYWARKTFPGAYIKAQNKWFDAYDGEKAIILDDLDTDVLAHHLKIWADRYHCTGETKGGTVNLRHHVFVVTSNWHPADLITDPIMYEAIERRFNIIEKLENIEIDNYLI
jgi:hypothetical protein